MNRSKNTSGLYIKHNFFENSFTKILITNGVNNVNFSDNVYKNNFKTFGKIVVNGGNISIVNNVSSTDLILNFYDKGFFPKLNLNSFPGNPENVKSFNLDNVRNQYKSKFNSK